jgi:WD40 repeat protein
MDGLLGQWDAVVHKQVSVFLAHTRPVSAIAYATDGSALATASWDRQVILWNPCREREGRTLAGHADIVAGCRFTPDGKTLVSWSHDCTVRLWDVARAKLSAVLPGHADRVTAGAVCPDGRWLATGSRDGSFKLWELPGGREVQSVSLGSEVRGCFFLLDAESLVSVDAAGQLVLHGLPDLEARSELATQLSVQCGDLAPSGGQLVLGCADGRIRFVAVDGYDSAPLLVTPTQTSRHTANVFERLLGKTRVIHALQCTCPACRQSFELPGTRPGQPAPCPNCHRSLRLTSFHHTADPAKC